MLVGTIIVLWNEKLCLTVDFATVVIPFIVFIVTHLSLSMFFLFLLSLPALSPSPHSYPDPCPHHLRHCNPRPHSSLTIFLIFTLTIAQLRLRSHFNPHPGPHLHPSLLLPLLFYLLLPLVFPRWHALSGFQHSHSYLTSSLFSYFFWRKCVKGSSMVLLERSKRRSVNI